MSRGLLQWSGLLLCLGVLAWGGELRADDDVALPDTVAPVAESSGLPPDAPRDTLTVYERVDGAHSYVSNNVEALSRRIDAFFGAERAYQEGSGTYIQIRGSSIYRKAGQLEFDNQVKARLDLPNLKRRFALVLESDPDSTIADANNTSGDPTLRESLDKQETAAASLQVILREERERWDIRLQPGIKLHMPPETFIRLRMRRPVPLSETWLTRYTLTPGWYDSRGWEMKGEFDLERGTGRDALFRASSEAVWLLDEPDNLSLAEVISFSHPLRLRERMAYAAGVTGETHPTFEDVSYFVNIRYRRDIHQGWLFLELKPQVDFLREENFKPDPSFAVTLEILFGSHFSPPPAK